jgi:hypothetical protein
MSSAGGGIAAGTVHTVTDAEVAAPEIPAWSVSILERWGLTPWDAAVGVVGLLLLVAYAPALMFDSWTPRMAILLAVMPVGLALIVSLCRRRDVPAMALAAALGWTLLCSVLSPSGRLAVTGTVGRDLSALTIVGSSAFWALGRTVSDRGVHVLERVVLWGAGAGALLGTLQVVLTVDSGPLALSAGRPAGLLTNPVYFGAVCAAGLAIGIALWSESSWRSISGPLVVCGIATSLSGSRVALASSVVVGVALVVVRRNKTTNIAAALGLVALAAGVLLDRAAGAGRNAADRLTSDAGGGRTTVWRYGLDAFADRPLFGYGFGEFRPAVQSRFSAGFVRDYAAEEITQPWFDPHNAVITVLVAVGVVGLVMFLAWAFSWARLVRGPLVWALVPLALSWMLQPMSLFTLPLAMTLFGAAGTPCTPRVADLGRRTVAATVAFGVLAAAYLLTADISMRRATNDLDGDRAATAAAMFGHDPISGDLVAQTYSRGSAASSQAGELRWRARVASWEPDRPHWWSLLAQTQISLGLLDEAEESVANALELQRYNVRSLNTEAVLAIYRDDEPRLQAALDALCLVSPSDCELSAAGVLEEFVPATSP